MRDEDASEANCTVSWSQPYMEEETDVSRKRAAPFSGEDGTRTLARQPNPNPCPSVLLLYPRVTAQTWGLPLVAGSTLCPRQKDEEEKRG